MTKAYGLEGDISLEFFESLKNAAMTTLKMSMPAFTQPCTNDCFTIETKKLAAMAEKIFPDKDEFKFVISDRKCGRPLQDKNAFLIKKY